MAESPTPYELLERLRNGEQLDRKALAALVAAGDPALRSLAAEWARETAGAAYGDKVFIRGLIEISSFCRNDCLYCGIRRGNRNADRYRLRDADVLSCCRIGHALGFRSFVLQGGEDPHFDDDRLAGLVQAIRTRHPDSAITLSCGERGHDSYRRLFRAGADRYLLRHETATPEHYARLHPSSLSLENRRRCLFDLKAIGYQTGSGFMVGSPFQTPDNLAADLLFLRELQPEMVGLGPFIPHRDTPFAEFPPGDVGHTLYVISLVRLLLPNALIPATTALASLDAQGREKGILAGANVVMPNLSPPWARDKYLLYNNKLHSEAEAAENLEELRRRMAAIGRRIVVDRGDYSGGKRIGKASDAP